MKTYRNSRTLSIIEDINRNVVNIVSYESLSSLISSAMDEQLDSDGIPHNYYYLVHLTNPAQTYFSRLNPDVKKTPEIAKKLARGKQLHNFTGMWLKTLPDFIVEEGLLDGAWMGVPGVRGKIDQRIGDSILEFKTKDTLPDTPEDVISNYPQDLEQLAFYSVIHPSRPKINYLVFMKNSSPYELKAFKMIVTNQGGIKSILISRIRALNQAFKTGDPSKLGRCRYYDRECHHQTHESCCCDKLEPINNQALQRAVSIEFDEKFTSTLEEAREKFWGSGSSPLSIIDIIAPRKHFMRVVLGLESTYKNDKTAEFKAFIWSSMSLLKRSQDIDLSNQDKISIITSQVDPRMHTSFRWLKIKSSTDPQGEILPYVDSVNFSYDRTLMYKGPSSYHIAELGIICALYGKSKGLIIRVFPNLNHLVQVFMITYRNIEEVQRLIKQTINDVELAETRKDLSIIPACPQFMNDNDRCPLMKQCLSNNGCK